jgi:hypothetical protein
MGQHIALARQVSHHYQTSPCRLWCGYDSGGRLMRPGHPDPHNSTPSSPVPARQHQHWLDWVLPNFSYHSWCNALCMGQHKGPAYGCPSTVEHHHLTCDACMTVVGDLWGHSILTAALCSQRFTRSERTLPHCCNAMLAAVGPSSFLKALPAVHHLAVVSSLVPSCWV